MGFSTDCIHAGQEPEPVTGVGHLSDLPDLDLRAAGARQAQGLRIRADEESDALRRSKRTWPRSNAASTRTASRPACRRPTRSSACSSRAITSSPARTCTAARSGSSARSARSSDCSSRTSTPSMRRRSARGAASEHEDRLPRDADQSDDDGHRHRRVRRGRAQERRAGGGRQHLLLAVPAAADRARRGHRRALDDEVPQRPLGLGRRRGRSRTTTSIAEQIGFLQNAVGAILSPFDSWLVLRGVKTLAVRMKQHEENGAAMANYLSRSRRR